MKASPDFFQAYVVTMAGGDVSDRTLIRFTMYDDTADYLGWLCVADAYSDVTDEPDSVRDPFTGWVGEHRCHTERCPVPWSFSDMDALVQELCGTDAYDSYSVGRYRP